LRRLGQGDYEEAAHPEEGRGVCFGKVQSVRAGLGEAAGGDGVKQHFFVVGYGQSILIKWFLQANA